MLPGCLLCHCFNVNYYFLYFLWIQAMIKAKRKWKMRLIDEATDPQRLFFKKEGSSILWTKLYDARNVLAPQLFYNHYCISKMSCNPFCYLRSLYDITYNLWNKLWNKYQFNTNWILFWCVERNKGEGERAQERDCWYDKSFHIVIPTDHWM